MTTTTPRLAAGPVAEWDTSVLDLDAYLERIGYDGPLHPDLETFVAVHRSHVTAVPFENLDIMLGRGTSIDLAAIQDKIVHGRRGGYCYEMNILFAAALDRIGIPVRRQLIRTGDPLVDPRPRGHLSVLVEFGGRRWFGDVGFGSGLFEPIPLDRRGQFTQGEWTYRLTGPGPDGAQRLQELQVDTWVAMYTITDELTYRVDVGVANENTSTSPNSPFVRRPITVHRHPDVERRLLGRSLTVLRPDRSTSTVTIADEDYAATLAEQFALELTEAEVAQLVATIPEEDEEGDES
jgi:N-hydroxyarylamine O-acetyltransferase